MLQSLCLPACNVIQEEEDYHWYSVCINDVMLCKLIYRNASGAHGGKCRTDSFRVSVKAEMNGFSTLNFMFENKICLHFLYLKKISILCFFYLQLSLSGNIYTYLIANNESESIFCILI